MNGVLASRNAFGRLFQWIRRCFTIEGQKLGHHQTSSATQLMAKGANLIAERGEGILEVTERQKLLERFLPQSKSHVVVEARQHEMLADGSTFSHLIVSRHLSFSRNAPVQTISLFFSGGLKDGEVNPYRLHAVLSLAGEVTMMREVRYHYEDETKVGVPTYYVPGETDSWKMDAIIESFDSFLALLGKASTVEKLPEGHPLMQPLLVRVERA